MIYNLENNLQLSLQVPLMKIYLWNSICLATIASIKDSLAYWREHVAYYRGDGFLNYTLESW